jgi:uncharacterized membrane protein YiaA
VRLNDLAGLIIFALVWVVFFVGVYALIHAARQRPDAYTATGKLTKPVWLLIIGGGMLLDLVLMGVFGAALSAVATGIYLVDVRPKILEIQGKSR